MLDAKKMLLQKYYLLIWIIATLFFIRVRHAESETEDKYRIVIFREEGFPRIGTPSDFSPEWLGGNLQKRGYQISFFNMQQLSNKALLNSTEVDMLVLPYGESFPIEAFDSIKNYLESGGGLFTVAGKPFWLPVKNINDKWETADAKPYEDFLAKLGIKYYQSEIVPSACEFERTLIRRITGKQLFTRSDIGLTVATSDKTVNTISSYGNVFPYQIPCRDYFPVIKSKDPSGEVLVNSAILVKSWRNPYRQAGKIPSKWCLIAISGDKHPFSPKWPFAKKFLKDIMEYLSCKIILHSLETDYACYRQGERIKFAVKALNYGKENKKLQVNFNLRDAKNRVVHRSTKEINLLPLVEETVGDIWEINKFSSDFYTVEAVIKDKGKIIDKEITAFVIWDDKILKKNKPLRIQGTDFFAGDKKVFINGTNYYSSKLGELVWLHPDVLGIQEDFKAMQKMGINFLRIHYHHSKWFRDYITKIAKIPLTEYFSVSDQTPSPSERSLRILDAIILLAQKYGLIFCMDIFSLVPEEMGNPIGWLGLKERIYDANKVTIQKEFVRILAQRYKDIPGITWDLWNEPRLEKKQDLDTLRDWASQLIGVFRENGDNHLVTIGDDISLELLDVLDYASIHTYEPEKFTPPEGLKKPFIFQEIWNDVGCGLEQEMKQAEKLKHDFLSAFKKGAAGFVPWQWTRQARLWNDDAEHERWDDELGLCTHDDGTLKPAGRIYSQLTGKIEK